LFFIDGNKILFFCLLLLCVGGTHAAEKNNSFQEIGTGNDLTVTLSVGTEFPGNIQLDNPLTLQEAESLALKNDMVVKKFYAESAALKNKGNAATRLPDPKLKLGLLNIPTDTWALDQEAMTRQVIGLQQTFPPYGLLDARGKQMDFLGVSQSHQAVNQKQEVLRNVRKAWLDVYLQYHTGNIIKKTEELFTQLINVTKSRYRSGQGNQQNVIRAQLERSLLKDREIRIMALQEKALAELGKWIGVSQFNRPLSLDALAIPDIADRDTLVSAIDTHPSLQASIARANAARAAVDIARSRYHPRWMMDVSFSRREATQRADLVSLLFTVDIPLFTENRQDQWVMASEKEYGSARYSITERKRNLKRMLDAAYSNWLRLNERRQHYRENVLPQASQNAKAALNAYRSQATEFDTLMRARLTELNIRLKDMQLFVDRAQVQVDLLYLIGGIGYEVQ